MYKVTFEVTLYNAATVNTLLHFDSPAPQSKVSHAQGSQVLNEDLGISGRKSSAKSSRVLKYWGWNCHFINSFISYFAQIELAAFRSCSSKWPSEMNSPGNAEGKAAKKNFVWEKTWWDMVTVNQLAFAVARPYTNWKPPGSLKLQVRNASKLTWVLCFPKQHCKTVRGFSASRFLAQKGPRSKASYL